MPHVPSPAQHINRLLQAHHFRLLDIDNIDYGVRILRLDKYAGIACLQDASSQALAIPRETPQGDRS
jgi:hypothetical protein